ncbi:MAG: permease prefix domain 2-containing transporter [Bacteroidia bacterium]|nr:permease prefix domain 2-containing transporter [Bacteroidia bacterium]
MSLHDPLQPPAWAVSILRAACHPDLRDEIEGDFREQYQADAQRYGPAAARQRCVPQLLSVVRPALMFNLSYPYPMRSVLYFGETPYGVLFVSAAAVLLAMAAVPAAAFGESVMLGLPMSAMAWVMPALLTVLGILYMRMRTRLYAAAISRIHIGVTAAAVLLLAGVAGVAAAEPPASFREQHEQVGSVMQLLVLVLVLAQLLYAANVLLGLRRGGKAPAPGNGPAGAQG